MNTDIVVRSPRGPSVLYIGLLQLTKEVYRNSSPGAAGCSRSLDDATTCPYGMRTARRGRIRVRMIENSLTMLVNVIQDNRGLIYEPMYWTKAPRGSF